MTVMGLYPLQPADGVGGHEGVGEVIAAGSKVQRLKVGDHVVPAASGNGTWRTCGVYEESKWFGIDSSLSLDDAATIVRAHTAWLVWCFAYDCTHAMQYMGQQDMCSSSGHQSRSCARE